VQAWWRGVRTRREIIQYFERQNENGMMNHYNGHDRIYSVDHTNPLSEERSEVVFKNGAVYKG
jgi:hypothetical protein